MSVNEFSDAIRKSVGNIQPGTIIPDGQLHRVYIEGDRPGSQNGWYVLFSGNPSVGVFGSWRTGEKHTWCERSNKTITSSERQEFSHRVAMALKARDDDERARHRAARDKAHDIWMNSPKAPDNHPYLIKKGVGNHSLRLSRGALVIPLRDNTGNLHSLQFIDGKGNKRFLSGGRIKGCFLMIGTPGPVVCIAEGYATAASIHEATCHATVVAFNCGNLKAVSQTLRQEFPAIKIIVCADNDTHTPGNPGLTKATEAAVVCGGFLAIPPCHGDFNDLYLGGQ